MKKANLQSSRALLLVAWTTLAVSAAAAAAVAVHPRVEVSYPDAASADPEARAAAACRAGRERDAAAIPMLLGMLGDETPVRAARCYEHGLWSPALQSFQQPSPGEQAALALASISRPAIDALVAALDDRAPAVRRNAAWAIGEARGGGMVNRSAALVPLIRLLSDGDATVRRAAAWGLSELKSHDAVEPLIVVLADSDPAVRGTAAFALGEIKDDRATAALTRLSDSDRDAKVREAAYWALSEIRGD